MTNILAIGGSNSKNSINKQLANYTATLFANAKVNTLDINDFEMPMYSIDKEQLNGVPDLAYQFAKNIDDADIIVLSLAENNGSYNVGFKNVIDWTSRIKDRLLWANKTMLLMATAPGERGGIDMLNAAKSRFPYMGANIKNTFVLPNFYKNFEAEKGIIDATLHQELLDKIKEIN